ncbi:MAG: hypothetical protein OQK98_12845 [Gammaproteobacteria bacterium]|nr:hypothetical protein [Gammaproteobacteria bacterium]
MAKKVIKEDAFESNNYMTDDDFEVIEINEVISTINLDARRRLEQIMEERELKRLTDDSFNYYF